MRKGWVVLRRVWIVLLAVVLTACGGPAAPSSSANTAQEPAANIVQEPSAPETDLPVERGIRWDKEQSIQEEARETASMIICFMSGEAAQISGGDAASVFGDTKWGDSALIAFPSGDTMLIDGGMSDYAPLLTENLRTLGIDHIDCVMLTHRHDDHYGGLLCPGGVLDSFEVGCIYSSGIYNGKSSDPAKLERIAGEKQIPVQTLACGDSAEFGETVMEVLWPLPGQEGTASSSVEDCNNQSLVVRFTYGEVSALFTGDLYTSGETLLLAEHGAQALQSDILKIPHHGRQTSSSKDFLEAVSPQIAVATGAIPMDMGTYTKYVQAGAEVYMDLYDGYVQITTDGTDIACVCSKVRDVPAYDRIDRALAP